MLGLNLKQKWKASREFTAGMKLLESGDYEEALGHLESSYTLNQKDHFTVLNLAISYLSTGNYELAHERICEAIDLSPKNPIPFLYKAFICLKMDRLEESEEAVRECLKHDPKNPHCNYLMGMLAIKRKNYSEARDYFEQYVVFNKPEVFARILLASEVFLADRAQADVDEKDLAVEKIEDEKLKSILKDFYRGKEQIASDRIYEFVETRKSDNVLARILLASEVYFSNNNIEF